MAPAGVTPRVDRGETDLAVQVCDLHAAEVALLGHAVKHNFQLGHIEDMYSHAGPRSAVVGEVLKVEGNCGRNIMGHIDCAPRLVLMWLRRMTYVTWTLGPLGPSLGCGLTLSAGKAGTHATPSKVALVVAETSTSSVGVAKAVSTNTPAIPVSRITRRCSEHLKVMRQPKAVLVRVNYATLSATDGNRRRSNLCVRYENQGGTKCHGYLGPMRRPVAKERLAMSYFSWAAYAMSSNRVSLFRLPGAK